MDNNKKEYSTAKWINDKKNELYLDLEKFIEENYIIENGIIKEKKDARRDTSKTNERPNPTGI